MNKNGIKNYIQHLANTHNVTYVSTPVDALADHITALADDVIENDDTKNLLVALKRAQVISGPQMNMLLVQYLTAAWVGWAKTKIAKSKFWPQWKSW